MSFLKKYIDKLYLKQWSIGFVRQDIADVIRKRQATLSIDWLQPASRRVSMADPFLFRATDNRLYALYESVSTVSLDGKITLLALDENARPVSEKNVLETEAHLSYPFVFAENDRTYVFPENAFSGSLFGYEFDPATGTLINKKEVLNRPIVDASILKHEGKYWLFGTQIGPNRNKDLYLFFADHLMGPYTAHAGNPVKSNAHSARPAGDFIRVDGSLYRPAQNCTSYYGESITINRIVELTESKYEEEEYFSIRAGRKDVFSYGIHTINTCGEFIIVDGQRSFFQPLQQFFRKIKNVFKS